ncbi:MAG: FmdE family protein [Oscillochloridaceae bacterium]|nr:FmdE family protein [Chloroflexaceae bacterium]MDW8391486.1 FmdE family protein [Oscillochloridaceae bacterium]
MTLLITSTPLRAVLEQSAAMHRHLCPRQVLGARMGMYASELLGLELPRSDKRLFTFVETDGCFADGVSAATGCWLGRRTLRLIDLGKVAATFVDTRSGQAIRIHPHPEARALARSYAPDARSRWHAYLEAYQIMPVAELLVARPVSLNLDLAALIGRNGLRTQCQQCGEEIINQREVLREGRTLCPGCAGTGVYWSELQAPEVLELPYNKKEKRYEFVPAVPLARRNG